jgi:hypothetical protein
MTAPSGDGGERADDRALHGRRNRQGVGLGELVEQHRDLQQTRPTAASREIGVHGAEPHDVRGRPWSRWLEDDVDIDLGRAVASP